MDATRYQTRVLKMVRMSPWIALFLGIIVIVFHYFAGSGLLYSLALFILGVALSPVVIKEYETGRMRYMVLYGALLGFGYAAIGRIEHAEWNLILDGIYAGTCMVFGTSVVFALSRERILRYLSQSYSRALQSA